MRTSPILLSACVVLGAILIISGASVGSAQQSQSAAGPIFKYQEVMIPMRDGVHLQTVILTPVNQIGSAADSFSAHAVWRSRRSAGATIPRR